MNSTRQAANDNPVQYAIQTEKLDLWYGTFQALFDVNLTIRNGLITSLIGPSGCGKSTLLRSVNRINEQLGYVRIEGTIRVHGHDIYGAGVELVQVRKQVGMVFQRPNPLPVSIRDNILFGYRLHAPGKRVARAEQDGIVEEALRQVLLWEKVKDRLNTLGSLLSGGQQQRLTIARALSQEPEVLMLDEFSIAVDPVTTMRIEDVLKELRREMTIILVTNLVQQARRLAQRTAFFLNGACVEIGETEALFSGEVSNPRTRDYIEGRFG